MVSDLLTRETREWNIAKVENLLPELKSHILSLRPSILGSRDSFIWPLQRSGSSTLLFSKLQIPLPPYGFTGNVFPWIFWTLWTSRNQLPFENRSQSSTKAFSKALGNLKEWEAAQPNMKEPKQKILPMGHASTGNSMEIFCNTDASWKGGIQSAGLAWIFTDHEAKELHRESSAQNFVSSPCMAEALAIREALLQAASLNYRHICVKSDSQVLVHTISARRRSMDLFGVLADIDDLAFSVSSPFLSCHFSFISRSLNESADGLAKICLATHLVSNPTQPM
ncbi:hypothetical protein F2Q69_00029349 [Brassica cretica]|uniref:RNase H type-1 domain-containing protein n=1 Tax=Brassica cretica TaxID=69181 RepID=A0A8S9SBQ5_BRACR|nr:hypothetical protein F2Q69_00029349 [Brassica cretica]